MKEFFSAFGSEVYRPLVTMVLPGAIGVFPWLLAIADRSVGVKNVIVGHSSEAAVAFLLATLFCGHLFEDIGSRFEASVLDGKFRKDGESTHFENWWLYLRTAYRIEPVGHRHLRTLVLRLKFELGCAPALVSVAFGCWFTNVKFVPPIVVCVLSLALAVYLLWEAERSHKMLSELRGEMLKGVIEVPAPASKETD